ncbi:hypothetical protein RMATCC62417_07351 [Rhizopus microsporus]|nr:hypothetical protein RMATCC62417_07351 [Rhizopus microsporus]
MLFAVTLLRDDALIWRNQLKVSSIPPSDWSAFKFAFEREFKPINSCQAARDKLALLTQRSSVSKYISDFRNLQLQITDMSAGDALDRFVRGLKPDLRVMVRSRFPHSLESAESMALAIEAARNDGEPMSVPLAANPNPFARGGNSASHVRDDPMDLDAIRQALNAECPTWKRSAGPKKSFGGNNGGPRQRSLNSIQHAASASTGGNFAVEEDDIDSNFLDQDHAHLLNLNNKETDLPLYEFVLCYDDNKCRRVKVLLDTGASANYISPRLLDRKMKVLPLRSCREVETAGGHITKIDQKVDFKLCAQQLSYRVQSYVFDMKFDIILGQQWFQQAKPIPQWSTSSWLLPVGIRGTVTLSPCDNSLIQDSVTGAQDFAYLISKRQLQRCARKKNVEELYLVHFVGGCCGYLRFIAINIEQL